MIFRRLRSAGKELCLFRSSLFLKVIMAKLSFLQRVGFLALIFTALLAPRAAQASHALGSDMSYVNVSPGIYMVQLRFYRDCSGISAPSSVTVNYEGTGCDVSGTRANAGGAKDLLPISSQIGNPYCRQQNQLAICDSLLQSPSNGFPNYNIYTYSGLVNIGTNTNSPCSDWVFSTVITVRPDTRNLGFGTDLYTEMHMNNRLVADDSSPAFSIVGGLQPLAIMYENTLVRYNGAVVDAEGDSLVYSMQRPLSAANTPIPYVNGHTLQAPIRLMAGTPPVALDQQGTLTFTPGSVMTGGITDENNKFVFVIQVDAWRRINGTMQKISTIRREVAGLLVSVGVVGNVGPVIPSQPDPIQVISGSDTTNVSYGDSIYSYVGESLLIDVPFVDANGDSIFMEMPAGSSPAGSVLTTTPLIQSGGISLMHARISWTPPATAGRSMPHSFYLRVRDNGCPNASNAFYPLRVFVAPLRPTGLVAAATSKPLLAYPNPFTADIRMTIHQTAADGATAVQIYDVMGRLVDQLAVPEGNGTHTLTWHPNSALPAGQYRACYRGKAGQQQAVLVKQ
jgi:hypothetical protein